MITLHNKDCLEAMLEMADNQFDLAIVDPPYGINRDGQQETFTKNPKHKRKHHKQKAWDNKIPSKQYFAELMRISKNQIIWGGNYFVEHLQKSMGWVYWSKGQPGLTMSDGELAWTSFDRALREITINRCKIMQHGGSIHPTQKPVALYKWLLQKYAKEGDTILDTHLGSGSIAIACHDMGFDLTAYEIDEEYFAAASNRLKQHQRQLKLF
jgi:site-specific DNA-methyltransferase (adenine-specific)